MILPLHLSCGKGIFISVCGHEDVCHDFEEEKMTTFQPIQVFLTVLPYCFKVTLHEKVWTLTFSTVWQTQNPGGKFTGVRTEMAGGREEMPFNCLNLSPIGYESKVNLPMSKGSKAFIFNFRLLSLFFKISLYRWMFNFHLLLQCFDCGEMHFQRLTGSPSVGTSLPQFFFSQQKTLQLGK